MLNTLIGFAEKAWSNIFTEKSWANILVISGYITAVVAFSLQAIKLGRARLEREKLKAEVQKLNIELREISQNAENQALKLQLDVEKLQADAIRQKKADVAAESRVRIADEVEMVDLVNRMHRYRVEMDTGAPGERRMEVRHLKRWSVPGPLLLALLLGGAAGVFLAVFESSQKAERPTAGAPSTLEEQLEPPNFSCSFYVSDSPISMQNCYTFHVPPPKILVPESTYAPLAPLRY